MNPSPSELAPIVRPMTSDDLDAVIAIEVASYDFPWTRGIFSDCIRVGYFCRVLAVAGSVQGYGVLSYGANEAHLLNLCIRREARGMGYGRLLLRHCLDAARQWRADTVLLEVRPSNHTAIALYNSMGFNEIGLRKDYYPAHNGREHALVFALALGVPGGKR